MYFWVWVICVNESCIAYTFGYQGVDNTNNTSNHVLAWHEKYFTFVSRFDLSNNN